MKGDADAEIADYTKAIAANPSYAEAYFYRGYARDEKGDMGVSVHQAKLHPRQCKVVELRFFGGLSAEETAATLKVSTETISRDWRAAKAWLHRELDNERADDA